MKAILEFNLPDDREEFKHANEGSRYLSLLGEIRDYLREQRKYAEKPATLEEIEKVFYEITAGIWE